MHYFQRSCRPDVLVSMSVVLKSAASINKTCMTISRPIRSTWLKARLSQRRYNRTVDVRRLATPLNVRTHKRITLQRQCPVIRSVRLSSGTSPASNGFHSRVLRIYLVLIPIISAAFVNRWATFSLAVCQSVKWNTVHAVNGCIHDLITD